MCEFHQLSRHGVSKASNMESKCFSNNSREATEETVTAKMGRLTRERLHIQYAEGFEISVTATSDETYCVQRIISLNVSTVYTVLFFELINEYLFVFLNNHYWQMDILLSNHYFMLTV